MPTKPRTIVDAIDPDLLASSHTVAVLVEVIDPSTGEVLRELDEEVVSGTVSLSSFAAVRGTLDITLADDGTGDIVPVSQDSLLAPTGNELRVSRGIETANEIQLVRLGVFRLERPTFNDDGQLPITGLSREARYIDASFLEPWNVTAGTEATTAIQEVLEAVWGDVEFDFITASYPLPALIADAGDDRWAFAQGIATAIGCELYADSNGVIALRQITTGSEESVVAEFVEGPGGILLGAEREWDREPLYNHWTASGESSDDDDDGTIRWVALDNNPDSPTYFYGNFGQKPNRYSSPYITDLEGAENVAESLLARSLGAPDVVNFDVIVDPARRPGDVIHIAREQLELDEYHVIDSITIPLEAGGVQSGQTRALIELAGG